MSSFKVVFVLYYSLALLPRNCQSFLPPLPISKNKLMQAQLLQATPVKSNQLMIEFQEPTTGVTVKLVGCMHYNPASIQLTQDTINELGKRKKLGAVVIESCDIRWNKTNELPRAVQALLTSEMKAATELAMDTYKRPVVLGDQRINITVNSLGQGLKETAVDLLSPWNGGWNRFLSNVTMAKEQALPSSSAEKNNDDDDDLYLNAYAFLDPKLLIAAPVSLIKYPLSYLFRSPLPTLAFFALVFLAEQPAADAATIMTGGGVGVDELTLVDWVVSLAVAAAEIALFSRIFLKELLVDRNKLLARNILEQCKLHQSGVVGNKKASNSRKMVWWNNMFATRNNNNIHQENQESFQVVYVKGAEPAHKGTSMTTTPSSSSSDDEPMAVVAVLGMAHCNGIAKLLKEQLV